MRLETEMETKVKIKINLQGIEIVVMKLIVILSYLISSIRSRCLHNGFFYPH